MSVRLSSFSIIHSTEPLMCTEVKVDIRFLYVNVFCEILACDQDKRLGDGL